MKTKWIVLFSAVLMALMGISCTPTANIVAPNNTSAVAGDTDAQRQARLAWWRQARFGMFIHWGIYSVPGRGEWVQWNEQIPVEEYAKFAEQFNPTYFDANAWAQIAKAAGMKYMVLTARHHDGFCMFDDGGNNFTSVKTAAHRDFVAEYVNAVRKAGLHVGLYYSPLDWRFPGYILPDLQLASAQAMRDQYHRQMKELLSNYGKLDVIWFDGGGADWLNFGADWKGAQWQKRPKDQRYQGRFNWEHNKVYQMLRQLQPQVVINGRADMPEDFHSREGDGALGDFDNEHPWELCTTLSGAWGWQPGKPVKPLADCIRLLVKVAGRDGNLLLNIGPRPDGQIDPPQVERLREIGAWLADYGQSIYGTRGGPFLPTENFVSTCKDKTIYLHILKWPHEGGIQLPSIPAKVLGAHLLGGGQAEIRQDTSGIVVNVGVANRKEPDTVVAIDLEVKAGELKPVAVLSIENAGKN